MRLGEGRSVCREAGSGDSGQASPEWVGLLFTVALLMAGLSIPALPSAASLVHSVYRSFLCATALDGGCPEPEGLDGVYGEAIAHI